jgi:hypothetical protein
MTLNVFDHILREIVQSNWRSPIAFSAEALWPQSLGCRWLAVARELNLEDVGNEEDEEERRKIDGIVAQQPP